MQPAADCARALERWAPRPPAGAEARFRFPAALPVFRGHFPGRPLLPGVYQLAAVAHLASLALGTVELLAVERAKWLAPAFPDQEVHVEVSWSHPPETAQVLLDATVSNPDGVCATCRLRVRRLR